MTAREKKKEESISRIIAGLRCSREEAEEVYEYDLKVEHGEKTEYDLDAEHLKNARKATHAGVRKMPVYTFTQRAKKSDATKQEIVEALTEFLGKENVSNIQVLNKERLISFQIGDDTYELTLVHKRRKK